MEPFDQEIAEAFTERAPSQGPARILLVGASDVVDPPAAVLKARGHRCRSARTLATARKQTSQHRFDLLLIEPQLPDGEGLELAQIVQRLTPTTKTIVLTRERSMEGAVRAMRAGAIDCVSLPIEPEDLATRIEEALVRSRVDQQREQRVIRLKKICDELNEARREISDQVDVLCAELVNAYKEVNEQMDMVSMSSEFRTLLKMELDVEELLRTTLEYVLTKTGPTNAAVFLPDSHQHYDLGAYVNYDCPRDSVSTLLEHLCEAVCPQMEHEQDVVSFADARDFAEWIDIDAEFLAESQVIAFSCHHNDKCLAVVVLFRNQQTPFDESLIGVIDVLRNIFAEQLSTIIRVHHRAEPSWPDDGDPNIDGYDDLDYGFGFEEGGLAA